MTTSVAMCTYNGEKYIEEQLRSIIGQTMPPDEIVILDDVSSDSTVDIAKEILDKSGIEHKVMVNDKNCGVLISFEKCIKSCSGDVIFTSDQDDVWDKDKIKLFMEEYEKDPECVFVFGNAELVDQELKPLGSDVWTSLNLRRAGLCDHVTQEKYRQLIMYYWAVPGMEMSFKKEFCEKAFPIPREGGWLHDSWLAINAPAYGNVVSIDKPLVLYRQHGNNSVGVKAADRTRHEEDMIQVQKVLFYLRRHRMRLQQLLTDSGHKLPDEYHKHIESYISLFKRYEHYEKDGGFKKALFLSARFIDNGLKPFDISRKNVAAYILGLKDRSGMTDS